MSERKGEEGKKVFTIRGLDPELYERFSRTARELGVSIGELMNEAMRFMLTLIVVGKEVGERVGRELGRLGAELVLTPAKAVKTLAEGIKDYNIVTGVSELSISRKDLEVLERPVVFMNIRKLTFEDDVNWELIDEKVKAVKLVDEVVLPKHIPKISFIKKCLMVKRIVTR